MTVPPPATAPDGPARAAVPARPADPGPEPDELGPEFTGETDPAAVCGAPSADAAVPGATAGTAVPATLPPPPTAAQVADRVAVEHLLRCWVRETRVPAPTGDHVVLPLPGTGLGLRAELRYWSACGWHRFGAVHLTRADGAALPGRSGDASVDAATVAALLARAGAADHGLDAGAATDLVARVLDSVERTTGHIAAWHALHHQPAPTPFLHAEQSLIFGHPLHPAPKSRQGWTEEEADRYSPERRSGFPLHWFAAHPSVVRADSALGSRPEHLAVALLGDATALPTGFVPVPVHPWQARMLAVRPDVARLRADGLLHDLGESGRPWFPTSSVRTVYRPDSSFMLKLSLGVRITNSRRENLPKELRRGVEISRLLRAGLADALRTSYPAFGIIRDPAYLAVATPDDPGHTRGTGLEVMFRENPFTTRHSAHCVAALTAAPPEGPPAIAEIIVEIARRRGTAPARIAVTWLRRYLEAIAAPVLWLDAVHGVALEAHQQNIVLHLDADGWPVGGWYRDNQGYYLRSSRRGDLDRMLPGVGGPGESVADDAVVDERLGYYLGANNILGMVGAMGAAGLAVEAELLAVVREFLTERAADGVAGSRVAAALAGEPLLRCKANLLTRLHGLDELVGPLSSQSVYVDIPNPLTAPPPAAATPPPAGSTPDPQPAVRTGDRGTAPRQAAPAPDAAAAAREPLARIDGWPFTLRPLAPADHAPHGLLRRWMNDPVVAAFWQLDGDPVRLDAHLAALAANDHVTPWIGLLDGVPISYWEVYRADLDPLAAHYPATPHDMGLHLLIGPAHWRGRGVGAELIAAVTAWVLATTPATRVVAEPDIRNHASVRAFERAGYRREAVLDLPDKRAALMIRPRALPAAASAPADGPPVIVPQQPAAATTRPRPGEAP